MTSPSLSKRIAAIFVGVCLVAIFVGSITYRLSNPGRVVQVRQQEPSGGMGSMGSMAGGQMAQQDTEAMRAVMDGMQRLEENPDDVETLLALARGFVEMGAHERSLNFSERAAELQPENINAHILRSISYFELKRYEAAAEANKRVLELDSERVMALFNLGILEKHFLGQPQSARERFVRVLELQPGDDRLRSMVQRELESETGAHESGAPQ